MSNFMDTQGSAAASRLDKYEFKNGENRFRLVGDVLRRYVYWVRTPANNPVLFECLSFNREQEKFLNKEVDHVPTYYPYKLDDKGNPVEDTKKPGQYMRMTPAWGYIVNVIDRSDGKLKTMYLKKTFFEEIKKLAMKKNPQTQQIFGDPTNPVTGYDQVIHKEKTGPLPINVKYSVDSFAPMSYAIPLTEAEIAAIEAAPTVHDIAPRQTPEEQLEILISIQNGEYDAKRAEAKNGRSDTTNDDAAAIAAARGNAVKDI